jgi:UDP-3-O-[3-hydroxymyristoyl] glucosamine N-acyltransferase
MKAGVGVRIGKRSGVGVGARIGRKTGVGAGVRVGKHKIGAGAGVSI